MLNKSKKLLASLLLVGLLAGCDVEALPSDYEDVYGAVKMEDIYDTVRNGKGESAIYNQLIKSIAETEIKEAGRWEELCSRIQEKIDDLIEDSYTDVNWEKYEIDAKEEDYLEVNDEKLLSYYRSQGYTIGNPTDNEIKHDSNYWVASEVLKDGSTFVNTYISDTLKSEVLSSMLNEQFIHDRKANSLYKTKQLRQIEYVYVDFDSKYDNYDDITAFDKGLQDGTYTLEKIEEEWKAHKKEVIEANALKAGGEEDVDSKFYTEFTSCGGSVEQCAKEKMRAIDEAEYYSEPKIYTNTDSPLLSSMTDTIFSSNIDPEDSEDVLKVEKDGKTYYYLKSQSDLELGANSLINVDTGSNKYYFVRFVVVDNINPSSEDAKYNEDLVTPYEGQKVEYAIAQALATTSSNYSNSIVYYLNKYNFAAHDDTFYQYIFDTYGYPEEE